MSKEGYGIIGGCSPWGSIAFIWNLASIYTSFRENYKNSEQLGQQIQLGIEPSTFRLLVFRAKPFAHCSGLGKKYAETEFSRAL